MDEDEDDATQPPMLSCVAEKALVPRCRPETVAYCPTMDLVTLVTEDRRLHVFRLNGQNVFNHVFKNDKGEIQDIYYVRWKPNGLKPRCCCELVRS